MQLRVTSNIFKLPKVSAFDAEYRTVLLYNRKRKTNFFMLFPDRSFTIILFDVNK